MSKGSDWANRRKQAMLQKVASGRVVFLAATGTMVQMHERIWENGLLTDGAKMTYKDDRPVYGYKPPLPKKPTGKGKTGKPIKGGYYVNYSALKDQQGRADMPFELSAELRLAWFGGATPTPKVMDDFTSYISLPLKEFKKAEGLAKMKGEFLKMNEAERAGYIRRCKELMAR